MEPPDPSSIRYKILSPVAAVGSKSLHFVESLGDFVRFFLSIIAGAFRGTDRFALHEMFSQMFDLGTLSIPVVMLTGLFIGAVLVIEAYPQFHSLGLSSRLGSVTVISVVKQIGPVLTGVMLAGRVGGAMTAELGTMRVTEQIEALRSMAADPVRTLAVPRVLACLLMTPILTVFSDILGIFGGWLIAVHVQGINNDQFWHFARIGVDIYTINTGLIKALFFGLAIGAIACYKGFRCGNGAQGVGRACTEAFVASFIVILMLNLVLALLLTNISVMLWPNQPPIL